MRKCPNEIKIDEVAKLKICIQATELTYSVFRIFPAAIARLIWCVLNKEVDHMLSCTELSILLL